MTDTQNPYPIGGDLVFRHRLITRLWHWLNAAIVLVMVMSGLMIFNAHPRLYWGHFGAHFDKAWLDIPAGFPYWMTIPSHYSLSDARLWHLAFAWALVGGLLVYLVWGLIGGHIRRDIVPERSELRPAHIWQDIKQHARLRLPTGAAALRYNVLQKLTYSVVLLGLLPLMITTGLAMSPAMDAAWPWLVDGLGGRQSARSLHFLGMAGLVAFVIVHLAMVVLAGPVNEIRSMITGRYRLPKERDE